jgi:hypothetical protein
LASQAAIVELADTVADDWSKRKNAQVTGFVRFGPRLTVNIDLGWIDRKSVFVPEWCARIGLSRSDRLGSSGRKRNAGRRERPTMTTEVPVGGVDQVKKG